VGEGADSTPSGTAAGVLSAGSQTLTDTNSAAVKPKDFSEVSEVLPEVVPPLPTALREAMAEIEKLRAENKQLAITNDSFYTIQIW